MKKKKVNYVDKNEFLEEIRKYRALVEEAEDQGDEAPQIPDSIGIIFMKIVDGIASRPNFSGYSYLDEMKFDGIENACMALKNFDPDISDNPNPFGYFSRVVWFAFLRRIKKEHKEQYIKYKAAEMATMLGDDGSIVNSFPTDNEQMNAFIEDFERKNFKQKDDDE